ncbi:hypothetical protein PV735_18840 [Streptomyces turgidiscabies]|nr:DUF6777 domain-containing protein [Streptomyces turgidiscabies]MDX3494728.1 hypothetical protein [Streptomyces turgidiscabies]
MSIALLCVLFASGCDREAPLTMVKAVASGVPSLAPFFDENSGLGHDAQVRSQPAHGSSLQQGSTPGLYGGTKQPTVCDVDRLEQFLTDPRNNRKAHEWARVVDIPQGGISAYLDRLTPVLLRHDTLVKNHDYKKEKAVPFDALLQAGIAVLVDEAGVPAVKCSCGNPLRPFKGATNRIFRRVRGRQQEVARLRRRRGRARPTRTRRQGRPVRARRRGRTGAGHLPPDRYQG